MHIYIYIFRCTPYKEPYSISLSIYIYIQLTRKSHIAEYFAGPLTNGVLDTQQSLDLSPSESALSFS